MQTYILVVLFHNISVYHIAENKIGNIHLPVYATIVLRFYLNNFTENPKPWKQTDKHMKLSFHADDIDDHFLALCFLYTRRREGDQKYILHL